MTNVHPLGLPQPSRLRVLVHGPSQGEPDTGRQLLLLHGAASSPYILEGLQRHLASHFGATVYAPYLPCHGGSPNSESPGEFIDELIRCLEAGGLKNLLAVGHSLGAWAVAHLARLRPDLVSAGVCLAMPGTLPASEFELSRRMTALSTDVLSSAQQAHQEAWWAGHGLEFGFALQELMLHPARTSHFNEFLQQWPLAPEVLDTIRSPLEILCGGSDRAVGDTVISSSPTVKVTVVGRAPHCFPWLREFRGVIDEAVWRSFLHIAPVDQRSASVTSIAHPRPLSA